MRPLPVFWNEVRVDILTKADLDLAWKRVKQDRPDRCFVTHPELFSWIETDLDTWLIGILSEIHSDSGYTPQGSLTCYCPKPGWMIRPGSVLDLKDETVFNALLGSFHTKLWKGIGWSQGNPDVAYELREAPHRSDWLKPQFHSFKEWRTKSLGLLNSNCRYVLFTDIAGYYENVDLDRLHSDLGALGVESPVLSLLLKCLRRWATPRLRGIPQGYSGSDLLAKLYMDAVDKGLQNLGYNHLRYVDDFRIFCDTELQAKKVLFELNDLLRFRGLNLQSAKTEILSVDKAREKIDGVAPVLNSIKKKLMVEIGEFYDLSNPYATVGEIDRILESHPEDPAPSILEIAFDKHFQSATRNRFDKTLFHFLLNRLGKAKSSVALSYCLQTLSKRPDETSYVLNYFGQIDMKKSDCLQIVSYAASKDAIYEYQLYQIARWFYCRDEIPDEFLRLCRSWAFDKNKAAWLRSYAVAILGVAGDRSDLDNIQSNYDSVTTGIERADIISALARMETSRRNTFYGRVERDGDLPRRAVLRVRTGATSKLR